jgi:hypothetical protein
MGDRGRARRLRSPEMGRISGQWICGEKQVMKDEEVLTVV